MASQRELRSDYISTYNSPNFDPIVKRFSFLESADFSWAKPCVWLCGCNNFTCHIHTWSLGACFQLWQRCHVLRKRQCLITLSSRRNMRFGTDVVRLSMYSMPFEFCKSAQKWPSDRSPKWSGQISNVRFITANLNHGSFDVSMHNSLNIYPIVKQFSVLKSAHSLYQNHACDYVNRIVSKFDTRMYRFCRLRPIFYYFEFRQKYVFQHTSSTTIHVSNAFWMM